MVCLGILSLPNFLFFRETNNFQIQTQHVVGEDLVWGLAVINDKQNKFEHTRG